MLRHDVADHVLGAFTAATGEVHAHLSTPVTATAESDGPFMQSKFFSLLGRRPQRVSTRHVGPNVTSRRNPTSVATSAGEQSGGDHPGTLDPTGEQAESDKLLKRLLLSQVVFVFVRGYIPRRRE